MQETIYSVSQAVKLLEVQPHVLRYWEEEMKLPIGRNEMGHRYYTRWDIQVFLSIKELKKKGYSLKNIGELTALFYREHFITDKAAGEQISEINKIPEKNVPDKEKKSFRKKKSESKISQEFLEIVSRIVSERVKEKNSEEARYRRLDERIRNCQQTRRETAAAAEKENKKKKRILKKS